MDNKTIILEAINAFDSNDVTAFVNHVTDDIIWEMRDNKDMVIAGKENLLTFFAEYSDLKTLSSTRDHIIVDGDLIVVDGTIIMEGKDAERHEMFYCDIYELKGDKICKITSYPIKKL